jgi:hypothetical protein
MIWDEFLPVADVDERDLLSAVGLLLSEPNPFGSATTIRFGLSSSSFVTLDIYDPTGRSVARLLDGFLPIGQHAVVFDAVGLESGVYSYRLEAGSHIVSGRCILVR